MGERLNRVLAQPCDIASLAWFRIMFGSLMCVSALRFVQSGWVDRFFGDRTFFFKYWGLGFIEPLAVRGMYAVYAAIALCGALIALGLFYRWAVLGFWLLFTYAELADVTNYLNHYYLVSLLSGLMCFMPLSAAYSLDSLLRPKLRRDTLPAWMLYLLRFQVATVYIGAALAKCGSDWLVHAQPLNSWLVPQVDLPVVGPYLALPSVALLASWGGLLHDFLVPPLLLWRRTRALAFALLLTFHATTSTWFNIGVFPVLMPMAATVFFDPAWPRRVLSLLGSTAQRSAGSSLPSPARLRPWAVCALGLYAALQVALPLRTHLYGGNVLWHEQGMRFSWRVMLRDKHGSISYRVRLPGGREIRVPPRRYLTSEQEREMSGQPDLILQLAHHIAEDFAARGMSDVEVRVDALVSLNGRIPAPLIDPQVDLAKIQDGVGRADWILPAPREAPPMLLSHSTALRKSS